MTPNAQKPRSIVIVLIILIAFSLACNFTSLIGLADPDLQLEGDLTNQDKTDLQPYLGTSQSEIISVEPISGEDCPPQWDSLSPEGEVNREINGDSLVITKNGLSNHLQYDSSMDAFCREGPSEMLINQEVVKTEILDCVSFQTIDGVKISNHTRYYDRYGSPTLCFDQRTQILDVAGDPVSGSDSSLIGRCVVSPDMYLVGFTNISDEFSNESKKVCQGDFVINNISSDRLYIKYYQISDDASNHNERWFGIVVEPGEIQEDYFGSQKWTDGRSTLDTFTKIIAVRSSIEGCAILLTDENISKLSDYFEPLNDPCK